MAEKLRFLQETLLIDYRFKIWDAWRPLDVQGKIYQRFWNKLKMENPQWSDEEISRSVRIYVAAPDRAKLPPHSTGRAIDLTLCSRKTGIELNMGTGFDHFGIEAKPDYFESCEENTVARDNRRILLTAMKAGGFSVDEYEWWHFEYGNENSVDGVEAEK